MRVIRRTILDDRGERLRLTPPPEFVLKGSDEFDVLRHYDELARLRSSHASITQHVLGVIILAALAAIAFVGAWRALGANQPQPALAMIIVAACLLGASAWWPFRCVRRLRDLERQRAHLPPICPACTYDLRALERSDDGCTVCPECGGAWRTQHAGEAAGETRVSDR